MPLLKHRKAGSSVQKYLKKRKFTKVQVLRVFAAIMDKDKTEGAENVIEDCEKKRSDYGNEFFNTGRIGRRNALPDILGLNCCTTSTADLPQRLSALTTDDISGPSSSSQQVTSSNSKSNATLCSTSLNSESNESTSQINDNENNSCVIKSQPADETRNS